MTRPFTPEQVADRWGVSANTVRTMIKEGALSAFRVGRLYRIPGESVQEIEACRNSKSDASEGNALSPGGPMESGDVIVLGHTIER